MVHSRLFTFMVALGLVLGLASVATAGDVYTYEIAIDGDDTEFSVGAEIPMTITLDFPEGDSLSGFSVGICGDAGVLDMDPDGADVLNGEAVADATFLFHAVTVRDDDEDPPSVTGFTVGAALSVGLTIDPNEGDAYEMYSVTWTGLEAATTEVTWCTIGSPSVSPTVVLEDLTEIGEDGELSAIGSGEFDIVVEPIYIYSASDEEGPAGGTATASIDLDFADGEALSGFSVAVCNPADLLTMDPDGADVVNGTVVADNTFLFHAVTVREDDSDPPAVIGWTVGAALSVGMTIEPADGNELYLATYTISEDNDEEDVLPLEWCEVGDPLVEPTVVLEDLTEIDAESGLLGLEDGSITVAPAVVVDFFFTVEDEPLEERYNLDTGEGAFSASFAVEESEDNESFPTDTAGLSMAVAHDGDLLAVLSAEPIGDLAALRGGLGPEFIGTNLAPSMGTQDGWTTGLVYSFAGEETILFEGALAVMEAEYETNADNLAGDADGESTMLTFATDLGTPPVDNAVVIDEGKTTVFASTTDASVELMPTTVTPFIRGDANQDGRVNIADAVWEFSELFRGGPGKDCFMANDANADGSYNGSDPVFILNYRFLEGPEPGAPFPGCGSTDTQEPEDCVEYDEC